MCYNTDLDDQCEGLCILDILIQGILDVPDVILGTKNTSVNKTHTIYVLMRLRAHGIYRKTSRQFQLIMINEDSGKRMVEW